MNKFTKSRMILDRSSLPSIPSEQTDGKYSPADFMTFLPWACGQLSVDAEIEITKTMQAEVVALEGRKLKAKMSKIMKPVASAFSYSDKDAKSFASIPFTNDARTVFITATYSGDRLVHIKIDKTKILPRALLRLLGLIIHFYPHLYGISIHSGADMYTVYEMCKFLPFSNITELSFDNTFVKEANYDMILDSAKYLKVLSLARCKLEDEMVEKIASKLLHPNRAFYTLTILNLSSNRITDIGAKCLAQTLRTNRQIKYLNLASNMITDEGAEAILKTLKEFPLTIDEMLLSRKIYMEYLKDILKSIEEYIANYQASRDTEKKSARRAKPPPTSAKKGKTDNTNKLTDPTDHFVEEIQYEKAKEIVKGVKGEFEDPFGADCFAKDDGILHCIGNNTLTFLNLAYNTLSYTILPLLLTVLKYQKRMGRIPRGLLNICLEGNPLPISCKELIEINNLLEMALTVFDRRGSVMRKRLK